MEYKVIKSLQSIAHKSANVLRFTNYIWCGTGVEIKYEMYSPLLQSIEVLRLEKRLDEELLYLRDALPIYSTFSLDMEPEILQEGAPVPVNPIKVLD